MHQVGEQRVAAPDHPVATASTRCLDLTTRGGPRPLSDDDNGGGDASKGDATNSRFDDSLAGGAVRCPEPGRVTSGTGVTLQARAAGPRSPGRRPSRRRARRPAARAAASSSTTSELQPDGPAPIAMAWSTTSPARLLLTKTSTTSTGPSISARERTPGDAVHRLAARVHRDDLLADPAEVGRRRRRPPAPGSTTGRRPPIGREWSAAVGSPRGRCDASWRQRRTIGPRPPRATVMSGRVARIGSTPRHSRHGDQGRQWQATTS